MEARTLKTVLILMLALAAQPAPAADTASNTPTFGKGDHRYGAFRDPRHVISLYEWIVDGKPRDVIRPIDRSILILCWMPGRDGSSASYQISGIDGFHSRERTERFLEAFYTLEQPEELGTDPQNVLVAGNNWGAGIELKDALVALSRKHQFSVFYAGGWAFAEAVLTDEPKERLAMIQQAFTRSGSKGEE